MRNHHKVPKSSSQPKPLRFLRIDIGKNRYGQLEILVYNQNFDTKFGTNSTEIILSKTK